ncbi:STAS domain-containing protein [Nocardioides dongkuii]|uniref:STAS domain-containing protein n=1 Tax=Nocardioides dongkuii TaxID=2760089 RepID=UPI001D0C1DF7|nr:STAS domain-containing protein [Nocardioides dongkuii]
MEERPFAATASPGLLSVSGSVDEYAVIALRNALREQTDEYTASLAIDLSDADYLPSVAVSVLVSAMRATEQNGAELALVAAQGTIAQRVLMVCALPYRDSVEVETTPPDAPVIA